VYNQIPLLAQLVDMDKDFHPYYVFTAVRKFMFFLDPLRKGKIKLTTLAASPILHEFNALRHPPTANDTLFGPSGTPVLHLHHMFAFNHVM
jgi:serine/threonine-protein phosphatase 2A regulatory subunit B''